MAIELVEASTLHVGDTVVRRGTHTIVTLWADLTSVTFLDEDGAKFVLATDTEVGVIRREGESLVERMRKQG